MVDPRMGRQKEVERVVAATSYADAAAQRAVLREGMLGEIETAPLMKVTDFAHSWLIGKKNELAPSTRLTYANALDHMGWLGELYVDKVVPADVIKWRDELKGRPATVNGKLRVVKNMFADAKAQLQLANHPVERVRGVREKRSKEEDDSNRLTAKELGLVLHKSKKLKPQWYPLFATLALTGARFGAVTALKWSDVNLDQGEIVYRRAQWRGRVVKDLKIDQIRRIPIESMLVDALKSHRRQLLKKQNQKQLASGLVFPSKKGTLLKNGGGVSRPWNEVLKAAGIKRRVTLNGLRRTFNNLSRQVASAVVTRAMMGHVTDEMTEHYSFVENKEKRAAVAGIVELISPVTKAKTTSEKAEKRAGSKAGSGTKTGTRTGDPTGDR